MDEVVVLVIWRRPRSEDETPQSTSMVASRGRRELRRIWEITYIIFEEAPILKMGKRNSKLKSDSLEKLKAETYCKCLLPKYCVLKKDNTYVCIYDGNTYFYYS